jgi:3-deoxy-D-manno-octulosonic-acid transferase
VYFIYNCLVYFAGFFLKIAAFFSPKLKLFVEGRKNVFQYLEENFSDKSDLIWIHTASLGEFEQGLPIIERLKKDYKNATILVTFFSPSGYEIKKNTKGVDLVTYLPLDTLNNAQKFVNLINPKLVIFIKYEIWPNYLSVLNEKNIPTLLVSAIFNEKQLFFKSYGGFMRKSLTAFTHIFVQDVASKKLLNSIHLKNVSISGDTRFDRVLKIVEQDNQLDFMEKFKRNQLCFVAGSTWPEDEAILTSYINTTSENIKFVFAPHTIKKEAIEKLKASVNKNVILYSEIDPKDISQFDVLIIDTIGLLTKVYSYADIAYVGGGFVTGLHNTLEPAVFGIPVLIGPEYKGFKEAEDLVAKKGVISIANLEDFRVQIAQLLNSETYYNETKNINSKYIADHKGATAIIMNYIKDLI